MTQKKKKPEPQTEVDLARTLISMLQSDAFVGLTWNYALIKAMRIELPPAKKEGSDLEMFIDEQARTFGDKLAERLQQFGIISPAEMEYVKRRSRELGRPMNTVCYWSLNKDKGPHRLGPRIGPNGVIKDEADDDEAFNAMHLSQVFKHI